MVPSLHFLLDLVIIIMGRVAVLGDRVDTLLVGTPLEDIMQIAGPKVVALIVGHIQLKVEDNKVVYLHRVLEVHLVAMVLPHRTIHKVVSMEVPVQEEVQIHCQVIAISNLAGNKYMVLMLPGSYNTKKTWSESTCQSGKENNPFRNAIDSIPSCMWTCTVEVSVSK